MNRLQNAQAKAGQVQMTPQQAEDAAAQVMGLVGQRRQLVGELEDLHEKQLEVATQLRQRPSASAREKEVLEQMSRSLDRQITGAENALRAIETLIATRTGAPPPAVPAVPATPAIAGEGFAYTTSEPPAPRNPEAPIFGIAGASLIVLAMIGLWNYMRRMRRETREAVGQIRSELWDEMKKVSIGVDAIAVELERIGEGQRYVTKALAEKQPANAREQR